MTEYIHLQRCFKEITKDELADQDFLALFNEHIFSSPIGWPELLKHSLVILLAEAGSGKSMEMEEQKKRLFAEGKFAFFIRLQQLAYDDIPNCLSLDDEKNFQEWKTNGTEPAWFFLDSVDELKLTLNRLDRALLRFSRAIGNHLERARIIISCRAVCQQKLEES